MSDNDSKPATERLASDSLLHQPNTDVSDQEIVESEPMDRNDSDEDEASEHEPATASSGEEETMWQKIARETKEAIVEYSCTLIKPPDYYSAKTTC